jgi:hypothetical protein
MYFKNNNLYAIKDLADIAYSRITKNNTIIIEKENNERKESQSIKGKMSLGTILILG